MNPISLGGTWRFELDREDAGVESRWFSRELSGCASLPGSITAQGFGDEVNADTKWTGTIFGPDPAVQCAGDSTRMRCWLQPDRVYVGAAWFQKGVEVPSEWAGRRVMLVLERPHWYTRVWLDDREVGTGDSLSVPHEFELGIVKPGRHRLTIRVDNRVRIWVGENAHSISDHTQGNWNGIVGRIELRATPLARVDELRVFPNVATRSVTVKGSVGGVVVACEGQNVKLHVGWGVPPRRDPLTRPGRLGEKPLDRLGALSLSKRPPHLKAEASIANGRFESRIDLGDDCPLWDEFSPVTHTLTATIPGGDSRSVTFGLREIRADGRQLLINGRPLFLRGTLDCCVFPCTGHPPTDVDSWRTVLRAVVAHGLNHVRFHSWCPPEAAFVAGDELGVYFQVEAPTWPNVSAVLGGSAPGGIGDGDAIDAWTIAESERIVREYGNHPCFVLMSSGNEPGGPKHAAYLAIWLKHMRALDPRRLYTGAAGWPEIAENDFTVIPEPRIHQWADNLDCRLNAQPPATVADYRASVERRTVPIISHEIGQWSAFPPLRDAAKYDGHLKARNYEVFAESLAANGLANRVAEFVHASGRLQAICYKEEIESQLRTPGLGGFQLLGLQDFPGQGTAPVGVLDHFWKSKGYASADKFRRFCGATVPLARLARRVFTVGETLEAEVEVAHFGPQPLGDIAAHWRLEDSSGGVWASGKVTASVGWGAAQPLGRIAVSLDGIDSPARLRLVVGVAGMNVENDWNVWVYPVTAAAESYDVLVTDSLEAALDRLSQDGCVVFAPGRDTVRGDVAFGFTPIFWNTWCTGGQQPHTLGLVCDPTHPALAGFPNDGHTDWQWWQVISRGAAMVVDGLPRDLRPIISVIDDWYSNRRLALAFEARVGEGRLVVCSADLVEGPGSSPVLRQFRSSLLEYAGGPHFSPATKLSAEQLAGLIRR